MADRYPTTGQVDEKSIEKSAFTRSALELAGHDVTSEALARARELATTLNIRPGVEKAFVLLGKDAVEKYRTSAQHLPAEQQNQIAIIFEQAYCEVSSYSVDLQLDRWAFYLASHLSLSDLDQIISFYNAPIGGKLVHDPQSVTSEERHFAARSMLNHPGIVKMLQANAGYMQTELSQAPTHRTLFQEKLQHQFCERLVSAGFDPAFATLSQK